MYANYDLDGALYTALYNFSQAQKSFGISLDEMALSSRKLNKAILFSFIYSSKNKEVKKLYCIYKKTKNKRIKNKQMKKILFLMRRDLDWEKGSQK